MNPEPVPSLLDAALDMMAELEIVAADATEVGDDDVAAWAIRWAELLRRAAVPIVKREQSQQRRAA